VSSELPKVLLMNLYKLLKNNLFWQIFYYHSLMRSVKHNGTTTVLLLLWQKCLELLPKKLFTYLNA